MAVLVVVGTLPAVANTAPQASADSTATHAQTAVLLDVLANDQDTDGDLLTVGITSAPLLGTAVVQEDGTVLYTPDPASFEGAGGDSFTYQVSDGRGGTASAAVTVGELPVPVELQPVAAPTVLLATDFTGGGLQDWTITDHQDSIDGPSNWFIHSNGHLAQTSNIGPYGTVAAYTAGSGWTDYRVRASMWSGDDDAVGIVFRYQDFSNFYVFHWSNFHGHPILYRVVAGTFEIVTQGTDAYRKWDPYLVEIEALGSALKVWLDGALLFDVVDSTFSSGTVGFFSSRNIASYFDNLEVVALPVEVPPVLFEDDFTDGDLAGWTIADVGKNDGPSNWHVTGGELREDSNIYGGFIWGLAGGSAIVDAGRHWTDYRVRVKLRATDNDSIVVYLRFQDYQNNYAFHWNRQSGVRILRKMVGGVFTDLERESVGYVSHRDYFVELVAEGHHLEVWIDGEQIFAVDDTAPDALLSGTAGLGTEAMASAYFDNVQVTAIRPQEVTP